MFHAGEGRYQVRITNAEAEWLRRQAEAQGAELGYRALVTGPAGRRVLDLSVVETVKVPA